APARAALGHQRSRDGDGPGKSYRRRFGCRRVRRPRRAARLFRDPAQPVMTAVLELSELSAGYGPMQVVHDVNLAIAPGTRVGLGGLNGHGKTTPLPSGGSLVDWK